jgi:ElaB/YqjD/DUF883 family membrane-anchored ribosome-binding protein
MAELVKLIEPANRCMEVFSKEGGRELAEAQRQTHSSLESLRSTANFAADQAQRMREATEQMQREIAAVRLSGDVLADCHERFEGVKKQIEQALCVLAVGHANWKADYDAPEVERAFSASYTIEMERQVLQAALRGAPVPAAQQNFAGHSAELF